MEAAAAAATIDAGQLKAARELLGWRPSKLAERAKVSTARVRRIERLGVVEGDLATLGAITLALEAAGVIFVAENGDGPGVRLRKGP